jgi:hypothetical protein
MDEQQTDNPPTSHHRCLFASLVPCLGRSTQTFPILAFSHSDIESYRHNEVGTIRSDNRSLQSLRPISREAYKVGIPCPDMLEDFVEASLKLCGKRPSNTSVLLLSLQSQGDRAECIPAIPLHAEKLQFLVLKSKRCPT